MCIPLRPPPRIAIPGNLTTRNHTSPSPVLDHVLSSSRPPRYCNRDFADEDTLVQHQRAKHFRCPECNKQLNSAPGVAVHGRQVHKIEVSEVPDSLPGREDITLTIFGMAGVPEDAIAEFKGQCLPLRFFVNSKTLLGCPSVVL